MDEGRPTEEHFYYLIELIGTKLRNRADTAASAHDAQIYLDSIIAVMEAVADMTAPAQEIDDVIDSARTYVALRGISDDLPA